jgi:hypothetical protein
MVLNHLADMKNTNNISDEIFSNDMMSLVTLGCVSGNYTETNREKRDAKGTAKADELFVRYRLQIGSVGKNKRAVTLPRVLLALPILTYNVMAFCPDRNFPGPFDSPSLPKCMKNPVFPSLIPLKLNSAVKTSLLIAYCCYTCDQTKFINKDKSSENAEVLFPDQMFYVNIGHKSTEPTAAERATVWGKDGKGIKDELEDNISGILIVLNNYKNLVNQSYEIPDMWDKVLPAQPQPSSSSKKGGLDI